ncbi:hypothetical protein [Nocardia grenadensis]|uniref:hypothetical protein n=1 Tax=Nocardia grenadensis TaxID=931537 RepID=UPI003D92D5E1
MEFSLSPARDVHDLPPDETGQFRAYPLPRRRCLLGPVGQRGRADVFDHCDDPVHIFLRKKILGLIGATVLNGGSYSARRVAPPARYR